jgi:hypothetical protein
VHALAGSIAFGARERRGNDSVQPERRFSNPSLRASAAVFLPFRYTLATACQ